MSGSSNTAGNYLEQLDGLAAQIAGFSDPYDHDNFDVLLQRVAGVVCEADKSGTPALDEVVEKADAILDAGIKWAYSDGDYDFLPSYAHSASDAPVVQDPFQSVGYGTALSFINYWNQFMRSDGTEEVPQSARDRVLPQPWTESYRPHPKATRLSRFREGVVPSSTATTPRAQMIYQARCEVSADEFPSPINAAIAEDSSALAIIAQGGWKHREPVLGIYLLEDQRRSSEAGAEGGNPDDESDDGDDEDASSGFRSITVDPGLTLVAHTLTMDTPRRLVFIADSQRIKSFSWSNEVAFGGWTPARGENVHTLRSRGFRGPIAVLPGGRVARAGKGSVALWNVDELETHEHGRVGKGRISLEDVWRDNDNEEIERSVGSAPSTTAAFADAQFAPSVWHLHSPTGHLLCAEDSREASRYGCYAVDLEQGGKKVTRFIGHGGGIQCFSTSTGDARVFATGCSDGYARLFDTRRPLPVMTFDAGRRSEFCLAVELIHPDGISTVFTGGDRSQSIKMWDVRARATVYELATGNNAVEALAWDDKRSTLYAATECPNMDRNGYTHNYRPAKIPRWAERDPDVPRTGMFGMSTSEDEEEGEEEDEDEYDSLEDDDGEHYWPKDAYHSERHYGYAYDAGEHMLLRYHFKQAPDSKILPDYGRAGPGSDDGYSW
ncbi:hypothetical protein C8Q73DRAFT_297636 [Cubamyces lactineus]|nr:hypothetical protein C8Q73DRAFT_297636 [Cubamyces lactineus]